MTLRGKVKNGMVVLDPPGRLPDGVVVEVRPLDEATPIPSLYERLKDVIGIAEGLPPDMAENHDHYIHGSPRQS